MLATEGHTQPRTPNIAHDTTLRGWPWAEGTHAWIEPTAMHLIALHAVGQATHPRSLEATQLLLDRQLPAGGCNYGNTIVFNQRLLPHVQSTGLSPVGTGARHDGTADGQVAALPDQRLARDRRNVLVMLRGDGTGRPRCRPSRPAGSAAPGLPPPGSSQQSGCLSRSPHRFGFVAARGLPSNYHRVGVPRECCLERTTHDTSHHAPQPVVGGAATTAVLAGPVVRHMTAPRANVFVARGQSYAGNLTRTIRDGLLSVGVPAAFWKNKRVLLKPNLVEPSRDIPQMTTHPAMIVAAAAVFRQWDATVTVGEAPGHVRDTEMALIESGVAEVLQDAKLPFADLNYEEVAWRANRGKASPLDGFYFPQSVVEADVVVSMPKMKTHHWVGDDRQHEKSLWRATGDQVWLAQERAASCRHSANRI